MSEYLNVQVYNGSYDSYGDTEITNLLYNGMLNVKYQWTMAHQVADFYYIASRENIDVQDGGPVTSGISANRYSIVNCTHLSSFIVGFHGTITWRELDGTPTKGKYGSYFRTSGLLEGLGITRQITNQRYANMATIIESDGFYYQQ